MAPTVPALPKFPADFDSRSKSFMVRGTNGATNIRLSPSTASTQIGTIAPTPMIIQMIDPVDLRPDERLSQTINGRSGVWVPVLVGTSLKGWVFNGYLDAQPVIVQPPPVVLDPPKPTTVKWGVAITAQYEGTPTEREKIKQAYAGLADFLRLYMNPAPEITFSESEADV